LDKEDYDARDEMLRKMGAKYAASWAKGVDEAFFNAIMQDYEENKRGNECLMTLQTHKN
jgi:ribosomal protein S17E